MSPQRSVTVHCSALYLLAALIVCVCGRGWYEIDIGCQLMGLVTIGIDHMSSMTAMQGILQRVQPWCVIVDSTTQSATRDAIDRHAESPPRLLLAADPSCAALEGVHTLTELMEALPSGIPLPPPVSRTSHELATLICSSGSSGVPKAIALTEGVWSRRVYPPRPGNAAAHPAHCLHTALSRCARIRRAVLGCLAEASRLSRQTRRADGLNGRLCTTQARARMRTIVAVASCGSPFSRRSTSWTAKACGRCCSSEVAWACTKTPTAKRLCGRISSS